MEKLSQTLKEGAKALEKRQAAYDLRRALRVSLSLLDDNRFDSAFDQLRNELSKIQKKYLNG